jgi:ABC-type sulfate transport system substrate-binding protein
MDKRIIKALINPYYACNAILNRLAPYIHDDELIVKWNYFLSLHKKLNLDNPQTFNEKLQWLKLHDRHAEYTVMADKLAVKDYIAKVLGAEYVFDTIGVWNKFDDIDFSKLPDQLFLCFERISL